MKNTTSILVNGVDRELHKAVKNYAYDNRIKANEVWLDLIEIGAKVKKITKKKAA